MYDELDPFDRPDFDDLDDEMIFSDLEDEVLEYLKTEDDIFDCPLPSIGQKGWEFHADLEKQPDGFTLRCRNGRLVDEDGVVIRSVVLSGAETSKSRDSNIALLAGVALLLMVQIVMTLLLVLPVETMHNLMAVLD